MKGRYLVLGVLLLTFALLFVGGGAFEVAKAAVPPAPICAGDGAFQGGPFGNNMFQPMQLSPCSPEVTTDEVPFWDEWVDSAHNDADSESFRHWDEDGAVRSSCARCHSTTGYINHIEGQTAVAVPLGETVECVACHNDTTLTKTSVTFPSGVTLENLGDESRCMECHQGRESKVSVDDDIANDCDTPEELDTVCPELGFANIHYYAAAATQYGQLVHGGYEYWSLEDLPGPYDINFRHVEEYDQCYECHDMHTLELRLDECAECHVGVTEAADLKDVRMDGSLADYDGDGNTTEGVYYEIMGLMDLLYPAIQDYGENVAGTPIVYNAGEHPYWFDDQGNDYESWTPRLLKAAYNYQVAKKDPGEHAHGGKYIIQLLHDSIVDLNNAISNPVNMENAARVDPGHFAGSEEAWRHWDEDDYIVSGSCSRCHSADGLPLIVAESNFTSSRPSVNYVSIGQPASNGLECRTCHDTPNWPDRYAFPYADFPSGDRVTLDSTDSNLCLQCHQGRASGQDVADAIEGKDEDTADSTLRFINVHYFAAGATLFGADVNGIYEFPDAEYKGQFQHVAQANVCVECHNTHQLGITWQAGTNPNNPAGCACHGVTSDEGLVDIRISAPDYNGNGNTTEGIYYELETFVEEVYAGMQAYASANPGTDPIVYNPARYPYWFNDQGSSYATWTPRLLKAAYNYQYAQKDPGKFAHNAKYVMQALYDNLADLDEFLNAGLTDGLIRP